MNRSAAIFLIALGGCGQSASNWNTAPNRDTHVRFFPISASSTHSAVDCNQCHGGLGTFRLFDCVSCHTAASTDPTHASVTGYRNDSVACYGCHKDGSATIDPAVHAQYFPLTHGAPTSGGTTGCSSCHASATDKRVIDCSSCHQHDQPTMTTAHAAVARWSFSGATCVVCHDAASVTKVSAHSGFPLGAGSTHASSGCLDCHTQNRTDKPWTRDFGSFDCLACHDQAGTDPHHTTVTGYQYASSACYTCHKDGKGGGIDPAVHTASYFPIAAGTTHASAGCSQCHTSATDRKVIDCTTCHDHDATITTPAHAQVGGFTASGAGCIVCHADSQVDHVSAHTQFIISAGSHHYLSACLQCHDQKRTDKAWAADFRIPDCLGCHGATETNQRHAQISGYSYTTSACLHCHQTGGSGG